MKKKYNIILILSGVIIVAGLTMGGVHYIFGTHAQTTSSSGSSTYLKPSPANSQPTVFKYGFDFSDQEPDVSGQDIQARLNDPTAVASALKVLGTFSGSIMDQSIYSFGAQKDPEPTAGNYDMSSITPRIQMITNAGGQPLITLIAAPSWMYRGCSEATLNGTEDVNPASGTGSSKFAYPPCPAHYKDFANLAAHIAKSYPQVKNFVVWSEVRDFYNTASKSYDAPAYTNMYNDVYTAIKQVRPDASVGGPYAIMSASVCPSSGSCNSLSPISGNYGYVKPDMINVLSYWLKNKIGADFIAIDGGTEITTANNGVGDSGLTDPATASQKFAAVDQWIKSQSNLPIWWMESHIQPTTGWTDQQAAAARIATLVLMNASGASVGMQWQPQEQSTWSDQGLWTSTEAVGGGKPTILGAELPSILPQIDQSLSLVNGQPKGVLVAKNTNNAILINTNNATAAATLNGVIVNLTPGQVLVKALQTALGSTPSSSSSQPSKSTSSPSNTTSGNQIQQSGTNSQENKSLASLTTIQSSSRQSENSTQLEYMFNTKNMIKAAYYLDSKLLATITTYPFTYRLDTTKILNGTYTYSVKIYYSTGQTKLISNQIAVKNKVSLSQINLAAQKYSVELIILGAGTAFCLFVIFGHPKRLFHKKTQPIQPNESSVVHPSSGGTLEDSVQNDDSNHSKR